MQRASENSKLLRAKVIIGWSEAVDFPRWGIDGVKAKVDTGARTSALHVENLEAIDGDHVAFDVVTGRTKRRHHRVVAEVLKWARVRSSNGHYMERCFICTRVRIGALEKDIELSLVSREKMQFRMLLGREALKHDFLVDVGHRTVATRKKRKTTARRPH